MRKRFRAGPLRACMCKPNKRGQSPRWNERKLWSRLGRRLRDRAYAAGARNAMRDGFVDALMDERSQPTDYADREGPAGALLDEREDDLSPDAQHSWPSWWE